MKTLTKMFLLCCWCMFSIGFAKEHIDQIQDNSEQQAIEEKLTIERQLKEAEEAEKQALKAELEAQNEPVSIDPSLLINEGNESGN